MQFTTTASLLTIALLSSSTALAAPTPESQPTDDQDWHITNMQRTCNEDDTSCAWSFTIRALDVTTTCAFTVSGSPASQTDVTAPQACSSGGSTSYTVTTGWSLWQDTPGTGFTTLALVGAGAGEIVWPAYSDAELAGGVVAAEKSYTPVALS